MYIHIQPITILLSGCTQQGEKGKKKENNRIVSLLVSWRFRPSQPKRIISGLRKTFIKRYLVKRTNKAEKDQKNRDRKRRVVGRIYGMKYS